MASPLKAVVIDDDRDLASLVSELLRDTGRFSVSVAHDGRAGCELCVSEKPDVVLLDYVMPVMKGDEVIRELRGHPATRGVPVILMSGLHEAGVLRDKIPEGREPGGAGRVSFMAKPFNKQSLLSAINDVLNVHP
ncbi:MAG: response regulator [Candidatus Omnitrophota bacterium]|nr:response regulator [Candidatus Omnitrophota bacterium]MDZ4243239.1 response regulator [Candidatus Omnitrophota bacterium]